MAMQRTQTIPRNPSRAIREKFRKRRGSLLRKADELAYMCQTDVYMILHRGDRYYTYSSTEREDWPPSEEEMVNLPPCVQDRVTLIKPQNRHFPLREHSGPDDLRAVTRPTVHQEDGECSDLSEEFAAPSRPPPLPRPQNRSRKQTYRLPKPPELALPNNSRPNREDRRKHGGENRPNHMVNSAQMQKKTFVVPNVPQLQLFQDGPSVTSIRQHLQPTQQAYEHIVDPIASESVAPAMGTGR